MTVLACSLFAIKDGKEGVALLEDEYQYESGEEAGRRSGFVFIILKGYLLSRFLHVGGGLLL